jgi:hypothetical protein
MPDLYEPSPRWNPWAYEPHDLCALVVQVGCEVAKRDEPSKAIERYTGLCHLREVCGVGVADERS